MTENGEFKIEKGVEMPPRPQPGPYGHKYPFYEMEVGDSFFSAVPNGRTVAKHRNTLMASGRYARKAVGSSFESRVVDGGVRIWRVS